jgi:excisionase family DNA binding protein
MNLLTLADAARSLGVAASTLRWQIRNRRIAAVKVGRGWYVKADEVERYRTQVQRGATA